MNANGNSYGSVENDATIVVSSQPTDMWTRFKQYMQDDLDVRWADLILLVAYVATGLLDSAAVFIWGSFVSMQTGNTVYLGLGLASPSTSKRWVKSGISLFFFCAGSFCFSRYHRRFHPKLRWVLSASFAIQAFLVALSALIVSEFDTGSTENELRWQVLVPIAIIAFQSSAQAQISRALGYKSLTSVVLTSIYCDLFGDLKLFAPLSENTERNHRVAAPLLLFLGAFIGGKWAHSTTGLKGALWTASVLKMAMLVTWLFWSTEKPKAPEGQESGATAVKVGGNP